MKEYVTAAERCSAEKVIEKSRFIANLCPAESVEQAAEFVAQCRKRYYDATHNCYAYVVDGKMKYSDDGEPQGTAGMPILECIKNNGLDRVCVVVTRYFGGIKLGAGGLVRAYSGSCAEVLKSCRRIKMSDCTKLSLSVDYSLLSAVRRAVSPHCREISVQYGDKVLLVFLFPTVSLNTITDIVTETTAGKAVFEGQERLLCPYEPL